MCLVISLVFSTLCPSSFAFILMWKRDIFTIIVFLMSSSCNCYVAFPRGAVGWSAVSYYGISCSSLTILLRLSPQFFFIFRLAVIHALGSSRGARDSKIGKKWPESSRILDYILC